jgi:deazaflavin-dependent oxidoreductase (nitroreductase family)
MQTEDLSTLQFIYVTTTGRNSGLPREIEIWFVERDSKFYIFAEHFFKANWVRNIQQNPNIRVRLGKHEFPANARILDEKQDVELWSETQELARKKYGWGDGLPVEITPRRKES